MSNHVGNGPSEGKGKYFDLKYMPHVVGPLDRRQKVYPDILHVIGNTPLLKLNRVPQQEGVVCDMYVKCEYLNPGGSVKDRIAHQMVDDAESKGILKPGKSVVIEPTSGNTGIGIALACAVRGYRCIIVLPEKMSDEKVNTLRALGAEIIRTPTDAPSESPLSNLGVARRLLHEIPHAVVLDQYNNPNNPLAHYDGTAEEILWSLEDDVDMVVLGAGTGGTVSGIGHKIKERCPKCKVVGVDPYGSILAEPTDINESDVTYYEVEGLGYDFIPRVLDRGVVDKWIKTNDKDALNMSRRLIKEEGILCGGSSGSAVWAAMRAARELKAGQRCVVLLPDSIRNYMTKFISEQWMEARLFKPVPEKKTLTWWDRQLDESLVQSTPSISYKGTTSEAIETVLRTKARLVNIVDDKGSVVGVFTTDNARRRLADLNGSAAEPLDKFTVKKFYSVDLNNSPTLGYVSRILDIAPFVVVVKSESGVQRPVGVVTSDDLLQTITGELHINGN